MSKDLAVIQNNAVEVNKLFGFANTVEREIAVLRIEGAEDEEGVVKAPKGSFVYDTGMKQFHASEVHFRAYVKAFQYRLYDKDNRDNNDMSIIGKDFTTEYRSASGRIACGKLSKKKAADLGDSVSKQQQYYQDNVKCKLLVFGVVSGDFTDVDTKEKVKLEDKLCIWTVSQSAFISIAETLKGIEKERRPVPLTPIRLSLKKERNGTVTFYAPIPHVETRTVNFVLPRDEEYLQTIQKFIQDTNEYVGGKYHEAVQSASRNDNFAEVKKVAKGSMPDDPLDID